jgi:hypothetical protein
MGNGGSMSGGLKRQDKGEMEADESGRAALDALNGRKSEILDIFLSTWLSFSRIRPPTCRTPNRLQQSALPLDDRN